MRNVDVVLIAAALAGSSACYVTAEDLEAGAEEDTFGTSTTSPSTTSSSTTNSTTSSDSDSDSDSDTDTSSSSTTEEPSGEGACEGSWDTAMPFANHLYGYAANTILPNHVDQGTLDQRVADFYWSWKQRYLTGGCGNGRFYVDIEAERLTVSEAHGYGMLIAAYMAGEDPAAQDIFDGLFGYFRDHPSEITPELMSWAQDSQCNNTDGSSSATDGDLDIAYALLLANKQWGSGGNIDYASEAFTVLAAINDAEVDASGSYVRLGDWTTQGNAYYDATRSSDFMPSHFETFAQLVGGNWSSVRDASYSIFQQMQADYSQGSGLLPDFVQYPLSGSPSPVPPNWLESQYDGEYNYNACRDPWRIGLDMLLYDDSRARAMVSQMDAWVQSATGGSPNNIRAGYWLDGDALPTGNYFEIAFAAPFGVAAMHSSGSQTWLNNLFQAVIETDINTYYGDSIAMLSLIAMSGNWWAPEAPPCQ